MASQVGICNLALSSLGANLITSIDEGSVEASLCKANYEMARNAVLEEAAWSFAIKRALLPALSELPVFSDGKQFQLPADCVRVYQVASNGNYRVKYTVEARKIIAKADVIQLMYVAAVEDPASYSANFVQAFAARLSADMAMPITNSAQMQKLQYELYQTKLRAAINTDALAGSQLPLVADQLLTVR